MRERRWPWIAAGVGMLAAAAATTWSVYLHWLPCRGFYLYGTALQANGPSPETADPSGWEACLLRMDTGLPFPYPPEPAETTVWASGLGVAAMVLVASAWLALVLGMRWSLRTTVVALLPTVVALVSAVTSLAAIGDSGRSEDDGSIWLWYAPDLAALAAFIAIVAWQREVRGRQLARLVVVIWGLTAFGLVHLLFDYGFMASVSSLNWDTPPLTGYLIALSLTLSAVVTVVVALLSPGEEPSPATPSAPESVRPLPA